MKVLIVCGVTSAAGIVIFLGILGTAAICKAVATIQRSD